jgi:hypothetical protein
MNTTSFVCANCLVKTLSRIPIGQLYQDEKDQLIFYTNWSKVLPGGNFIENFVISS